MIQKKPLFRKAAVLIMSVMIYSAIIPMFVETPIVTVLPVTVTGRRGGSFSRAAHRTNYCEIGIYCPAGQETNTG